MLINFNLNQPIFLNYYFIFFDKDLKKIIKQKKLLWRSKLYVT